MYNNSNSNNSNKTLAIEIVVLTILVRLLILIKMNLDSNIRPHGRHVGAPRSAGTARFLGNEASEVQIQGRSGGLGFRVWGAEIMQ